MATRAICWIFTHQKTNEFAALHKLVTNGETPSEMELWILAKGFVGTTTRLHLVGYAQLYFEVVVTDNNER